MKVHLENDSIDFCKVSWPKSVDSNEFDVFLNEVETIMNFKPSDSQDGIDIDYEQVKKQNKYLRELFDKYEDRDKNEILKKFVVASQSIITGGLTRQSIVGFES